MKKDKKKNNFPPKKKKNIKHININNNIYNINIKNSNSSSMREMKFPKKALINKKNKIVVHNKNNYNSLESLKTLKRNNIKYKDDIKEKEQKKQNFVPKLNDQEINFLNIIKRLKLIKGHIFNIIFLYLKEDN